MTHGPKYKTILVVDDDQEICELLTQYLQQNAFTVHTALNGEQMFNQLAIHHYDLIVLDVMMPGDDGFILCKKIRTESNIPIIMLTAGSDETDRIIGLELGADDYMVKPFNPRELLARIKAVLRRMDDQNPQRKTQKRRIQFGQWILDEANRELIDLEGTTYPLNGADYNLLQLFLNKAGQVLSRDELSNLTRGRESSPFDRAIDVQISRLRQRLGDDGKSPQLIKTVRGAGYILTSHVEVLS
ncbi:response regulator [Gynuella sp.]|uniref:response regulator n=1 Tax=Gynuella sp. TaxID=2969146 RepID=UPI003D11BF73